jgi:predicted esterase YcpF (UPF0227 family)
MTGLSRVWFFVKLRACPYKDVSMTQLVLYLHGYGSTGDTDTAVNLRRALADDFTVLSPSYDGSDPVAAALQLEALMVTHASAAPVLIGTSLGGFFANYLARVCNVRAVLINPALAPSSSLHKHGENAATLAGYQQLEAAEKVQVHRPARVVVIGLRDDVVDPRTNGLLLKDDVQTVMLDMGHRVEPAYVETIAGLARQLAAMPHVV